MALSSDAHGKTLNHIDEIVIVVIIIIVDLFFISLAHRAQIICIQLT